MIYNNIKWKTALQQQNMNLKSFKIQVSTCHKILIAKNLLQIKNRLNLFQGFF